MLGYRLVLLGQPPSHNIDRITGRGFASNYSALSTPSARDAAWPTATVSGRLIAVDVQRLPVANVASSR